MSRKSGNHTEMEGDLVMSMRFSLFRGLPIFTEIYPGLFKGSETRYRPDVKS